MHRALLLALWSNDYEGTNTFFRTCAGNLTTLERGRRALRLRAIRWLASTTPSKTL
jgi:hypothetical protein